MAREDPVRAPRIRSRVTSGHAWGAGLPVFCLPGGEFIDSRVFEEDDRIIVLFLCPHHFSLSKRDRDHKHYRQLCGPDKGFLELSQKEAGISAADVLDPVAELDFFNRFVRPQVRGSELQPVDQRKFTLAISPSNEAEVSETKDNDGTLIFVIRHKKDESVILMEERVPPEDLLFDSYRSIAGDSAFAKALLKRWLLNDSPPRGWTLGGQTPPDRVILEAGPNLIEVLDRDGDAVRTVKLSLPRQRPSAEGLASANEIDMPGIFTALAPEIAHLPDGSSWRVVLGHNVDRAYHLIAFLGQPEGPEAPLRILFDAYDRDAPAGASGVRPGGQISGDHRHEPLSLERDRRRHCWTFQVRAAEIAGRYDPIPELSQVIRDLEDTIASPDRYSPGESSIETEHWDLIPLPSAATVCAS